MAKIWIDFSSYGYNDYYPVDTHWMNYHYCLAEGCFENIEDWPSAEVDAAVEKIQLMFESLEGPMDTVWLGSALFNMAIRGLMGHPLPEFYRESREE